MPLNLLSVKYRKKFTAPALKILLYKVSNIEPSCSRWSWRHDELSTYARDFSFLVRFNLALVIGLAVLGTLGKVNR